MFQVKVTVVEARIPSTTVWGESPTLPPLAFKESVKVS